MDERNPHSTASIFGHPLHPMLVPFPLVGFIGAWIADLAYYNTVNPFWLNMSSWLILGGLLFGALAALAGLIDYFGSRSVRRIRTATIHMLLNVTVMILEIVNLMVHMRDGWTAVVPTGLTLSTICVLLLAASGWLGGELVFKHRVGVRP